METTGIGVCGIIDLAGEVMSEIDVKIVKAIAHHGGSVSLFELMSLLGDVPDSDIPAAVKRLEADDMVKIKDQEKSDYLITVREKALQNVA